MPISDVNHCLLQLTHGQTKSGILMFAANVTTDRFCFLVTCLVDYSYDNASIPGGPPTSACIHWKSNARHNADRLSSLFKEEMKRQQLQMLHHTQIICISYQSKETTVSALHHSNFYMPNEHPDAQLTMLKHLRMRIIWYTTKIMTEMAFCFRYGGSNEK